MRIMMPGVSVEHLVDEGDGDRSLSHRGGHALDVARANVAHREHAGAARLEEEGLHG